MSSLNRTASSPTLTGLGLVPSRMRTAGTLAVLRVAALVFSAAIVLSLALPAFAQGDTPIKVRGGATTFFSEQPWLPFKGRGDAQKQAQQEVLRKKKPTYCSAIKPGDLGFLELENFFPVTIQDFRRRPVTEISVPLTTQTWRIEIFGHHERETADALQLSKDGIALQASPRGCGDQPDSPSVRISPLGNASFYPGPDLIPAGRYSSNKRFLSKCSSLGRDRCERIAEIHVFDESPTKPRIYKCPDGECTIYIGKPEEKGDRPRPYSSAK